MPRSVQSAGSPYGKCLRRFLLSATSAAATGLMNLRGMRLLKYQGARPLTRLPDYPVARSCIYVPNADGATRSPSWKRIRAHSRSDRSNRGKNHNEDKNAIGIAASFVSRTATFNLLTL